MSRVRADYGANSTAGVVLTDRDQGPRRNTVLAADTRLVFGKLYFMQAQLGGSRTDDGSAVRTAPLWHLEFDRTGRAFGFNYRATGIGTDFRSDAGFVPRSDIVNAHAFNRVSFYGAQGELLEQVTVRGGLEGIWNYRDLGARGPAESALEIEATRSCAADGSCAASSSSRRFRYAADAFLGYTVAGDPLARPYVPVDVRARPGLSVGGTTPAFKAFDADAEVSWAGVPIFDEGSRGPRDARCRDGQLRAGGSLRLGGMVAVRASPATATGASSRAR